TPVGKFCRSSSRSIVLDALQSAQLKNLTSAAASGAASRAASRAASCPTSAAGPYRPLRTKAIIPIIAVRNWDSAGEKSLLHRSRQSRRSQGRQWDVDVDACAGLVSH